MEHSVRAFYLEYKSLNIYKQHLNTRIHVNILIKRLERSKIFSRPKI